MKNRCVAVIPARAGSKRLPNKNTKPLLGKPLIAWTIEAALASKDISSVVVTTDSQEIAEVAEAFGAEVPFLRPPELASDIATTNAVLLHAISELKLDCSDALLLLQPTSPLRTAQDIDAAQNLKVQRSARAVVSVVECEHSPLWANTLPKGLEMGEFLRPEVHGKRSQDLPVYYRLNGAIYLYDVGPLVESGGMYYSDDVLAYVMPQDRSVDIDTDTDFAIANTLLSIRNEH